jgi:NADPH:quinone reductase-like Zn-dependent oxidoreductase
MKAAFIEQYGGPEVLKYGDLPDPVAGPGQVVIDVAAASVNGAGCASANISNRSFHLPWVAIFPE